MTHGWRPMPSSQYKETIRNDLQLDLTTDKMTCDWTWLRLNNLFGLTRNDLWLDFILQWNTEWFVTWTRTKWLDLDLQEMTWTCKISLVNNSVYHLGRSGWVNTWQFNTISKTDKYYKKAPFTTQANNYRNFPDLKTKFKFLHRKCQCPPSPRHMPCAVVVTPTHS
jgi:hypothetical protein